MSSRSFFGERVTVKSLLVTDQPGTRAEVRARLISPRGELAVLSDGTTPIRHLSYVELRRGMLRGNHFHRKRHEYFYMISGRVSLHLADFASGETGSIILSAGDLAYIKPEIAHTLNPLEDGHSIEFAAEAFDPGDVWPHPLEV